MRTLLFLLLVVSGCDEPSSAVDQCAAGARSVDGVPCCSSIVDNSNCNPGDTCIADIADSCFCKNGLWQCGLPIRVDLSVPDLTSSD